MTCEGRGETGGRVEPLSRRLSRQAVHPAHLSEWLPFGANGQICLPSHPVWALGRTGVLL